MSENTNTNHNPMDVDSHGEFNSDSAAENRHQRTDSSSLQPDSSSRPSSAMAGRRRARVDDDDNELSDINNRDRNRPRTASNTPPQPVPSNTNPHPHPHQRTTMQFVLSMPQMQQPFAQFSIVMDTHMNASSPLDERPSQQQQPQQPPDQPAQVHEQQFTFDTGPLNRERLTNALSNLATQFATGIIVSNEREPDLKRGKIILKALEVVPRGLMQRMNAVGGVLGGAESQPTSEEQIVCPVCWEPLLEDGIFESEREPSNDTNGSNSTANSAPGETEVSKKSIVALPCRHIFHDSCLLPWLSRQTTCPSCRFNLDPEQLTAKRPTIHPWPPMDLGGPGVDNRPIRVFTRAPEGIRQQSVNVNNNSMLDATQLDNGAQINGERNRSRPNMENPNNNSQSGIDVEVAEGDLFLGPAVISAMSMVFSAEPGPARDADNATESQSTSESDPANETRNDAQDEGDHTRTRRNIFPPNMPQELRAVLSAIFGEGWTPSPNGIPESRNQNFDGRSSTASSSSSSNSMSPTSSNDRASQSSSLGTENTNSSDQIPNEPTTPATSGGIMSALLGALFGGPSTTFSNPATVSGTSSTEQASNASTSTPASASVSQTAAPSVQSTTQPGTSSEPLVESSTTLPQFQTHFIPLSNGLLPIPTMLAGPGIPRSFVVPPFPTTLASMPRSTSQQTRTSPAEVPNPPPGADAPRIAVPEEPPRMHTQHVQGIPFIAPFPMFPFSRGAVPSRNRENKKWNLPEGKGASVRQRVEEKERQMGLRCSDPSCGFAPTDETPATSGPGKRCLFIQKEGVATERACEHAFHSGCLVSAARVAGFEPGGAVDANVEVPCTVCRTHGYVEKEAWEEGVRQLQIDDA